MALNDVKFNVQGGGLGRLPVVKDYVSSIIIGLTAGPANWGGAIGKKYLSADEAEDDGIVEGDANYGLLYYFVSEFFRIAGASELYVVNASDANFTAQNFYNLTGGQVRQVFWYTETAYSGIAAQVGTIKTFVDSMDALFAPMVVVTNVKDEGVAVDGAAQVDLRTANAPEVSVLISGDQSGKGQALATSLGVNYIPAGGAVLGAIAAANVHENIGWVEKFNLSEGAELQTFGFSDGQSFGAVATSVLDTLNTKGYLFLRAHVGVSGAYVNDSHGAVTSTSDFAFIENNRTIQKGKRLIRVALIPDLNRPLTVDGDGKLSPDTVKYFENKTARPLDTMQAEGELSGYTVTIDPDQDVLSTSLLSIQVKLQPRGVARNITVSIGFTVNFQ